MFLLTKLAENDMIKEGEKEETMKLLHTADLHMDRSFEGLTGIPTALAKRLREANQQLLMNIVTVAIREAVDLVILQEIRFIKVRPLFQCKPN